MMNKAWYVYINLMLIYVLVNWGAFS